MMGQTLPSLDMPITKGTSGFLALPQASYPAPPRVPLHPLRLLRGRLPAVPQPGQLGLLAQARTTSHGR